MSIEKQKAKELFNEFYMVLFDSDSDKGDECLVSILSKKCALVCAKELENNSLCPTTKTLWRNVISEILTL